MPVLSRTRIAVVAAVTGLLLVASAVAAPAFADTKPPTSGTPTTVSTDVLPTAQINGVVWSQLVVGDTVYVGGSFSKAQPAGAASGVSTVTRSNILAYRLSTGALLTTFAPSLNGEVRALAVSADGATVYAGGAFTTANGATRSRVVALNASTGAVVSGFAPSVNGEVYALARSGSTLYLGGAFSSVAGSTRNRAAAVSTTNGAATSWSPSVADGVVRGIAVNSTVGKVALVGSFSTLNGGGTAYRGSGLVDATTGRTNAAWQVGSVVASFGPNASMLSVSSDGTNVYGTGYDYKATNGSDFEGTFAASWADGSLRWIEDCHGDTYSNVPFNGAVYTASHAHYCANIGGFPQSDPETWHRGLAFSTNATGTVKANAQAGYANFAGRPSPSLLAWFPDFNTGTYTGQSQGPWSVAAGGNYVVYGGEFTTVNGVRQQGLARFALPAVAPDKDGPRLSGSALTPTLTASGTSVKATWRSSWDRDNAQLTYRLYRGTTLVSTQTSGSTFWNLPTLTYTDPGRSGTASYHVTAADPWGNTVTGSAASITVAPAVVATAQATATTSTPEADVSTGSPGEDVATTP